MRIGTSPYCAAGYIDDLPVIRLSVAVRIEVNIASLAEYHGLRFLYSQRILVSDDGWKYVFSPGDDDELYDLTHDPHEMTNLATSPEAAVMLSRMRAALMAQTAQFDDPLRDCAAKFNGQWRTGSDQFDVTSAYLHPAKAGQP